MQTLIESQSKLAVDHCFRLGDQKEPSRHLIMKHSHIINHGAQTARNHESKDDNIFNEPAQNEKDGKFN